MNADMKLKNCFYRFKCAFESCTTNKCYYTPIQEEDKGIYFGGYDIDGNKIIENNDKENR